MVALDKLLTQLEEQRRDSGQQRKENKEQVDRSLLCLADQRRLRVDRRRDWRSFAPTSSLAERPSWL